MKKLIINLIIITGCNEKTKNVEVNPDTTADLDITIDMDTKPLSRCPNTPWVQVTMGSYLVCGLHEDGCAECWGNDVETDTGRYSWHFSGDEFPPSENFSKIKLPNGSPDNGRGCCGGWHGCGLTSSGEVRCWGNNGDGQTIHPSGIFVDLSIALDYSCAIDSLMKISCWGNTRTEDAPVILLPEDNYIKIEAGIMSLCGITEKNTLNCSSYVDGWVSRIPTGNFIYVDKIDYDACALRSDGVTVECWYYGGSWSYKSPEPVNRISVRMGLYAIYGLTESGKIVVINSGLSGDWVIPDKYFRQIDFSSTAACGVTLEGEMLCWGDGHYGETDVPQPAETR